MHDGLHTDGFFVDRIENVVRLVPVSAIAVFQLIRRAANAWEGRDELK